MAEVGRPTVMTPEVLNKLEEVFAIGGTDTEACMYADISHQSLYTYQKEHPEFLERKEALKERPFLKARQTIVKALSDPNYAFKFMERKKKGEFGANVDITTGGDKIAVLPTEIYAKRNASPGTSTDSQ